MPQVSACPDIARYRQLASGQLTPKEEQLLLQHLEGCDACAQQFEALANQDTLVDLIRQAQTYAEDTNEEQVARLVERLSKMGPGEKSSGQSEVKTLAADDATLGLAPAADDKSFDFLRPGQGPDELGRLGPYRILKKLGAGGMGLVFLAEDALLNRKVALKVMRPQVAASASAQERFLREARAAASIEHEHIVVIHQVGEDNGVPFLAMPLLKGEPLDERLQREGKLPLGEAVRIAREMAEGLAAAHASNLIHRDVKPGNVWLESASPLSPGGRGVGSEGGKVKLLDFGLARAQDDTSNLTQSGAIVGTPAYMAPEQARQDKIDGRADLFSLGCVLYQMLTGQRPFQGNDTMSVLMSLATETPALPTFLTPDVPDAVSDLTMRLLAKDPADRPASAVEVVEELLVLSRDTETSDGEATARTAASPAVGSKRGLYAAAAALLLALVGGGYWLAQVVIIRDKEGNKIAEIQVPKGGKVEVVPDAKQLDLQPLAPIAQPQYALQFDAKGSVRVGGLIVNHGRPFTFEGYATLRGGGYPFLCDGAAAVGPDADKWSMNFWANDPTGKRKITYVPGTAPIIVGKKTNLALVFTGRQFRVYVDGKLSAQKDLGDLSLEKFKLPFALGLGFTGEISEVRVSTVARYDKAFTPPLRYETDADTVGLYHFDEGEGEVLKDSSGKQNHGQINGARWVMPDGRPPDSPPHTAPSNYALKRDGKSSVQIPGLVVDFSRPCTMEGYVTARSGFDGGYPFLCDGAGGVARSAHRLPELVGKWSINFWGDDPKGQRKNTWEFGTFRVVTGKKTHLALVYTGRQFRLYVDGYLSAQKDVGDLSLGTIKLPFTLGSQFTGEILEIRVSKVARYDKDFAPKLRFEPDADTLALYHFDEGHGEVLYDSSGNGHHGKIVGAKWVKLEVMAAFDAWVKDVAKMPAEKQVEAVAAKLKERNPGFDGKVTHKIEKDVVTSLELLTDNVADISPVRALARLQSLDCSGSVTSKRKLGLKFFDLSPLNGMKLTRLNCNRTKVADLSPLKDMKLATLGCAHTQVSDLAPLKGMPLTLLVCGDTKVSDLSPLKDMPLTGLHLQGVPVSDLSPLKGMPIKEIHYNFDRKRDTEILRSIKTLAIINGKPAAEFWKEVEAAAKPIP